MRVQRVIALPMCSPDNFRGETRTQVASVWEQQPSGLALDPYIGLAKQGGTSPGEVLQYILERRVW